MLIFQNSVITKPLLCTLQWKGEKHHNFHLKPWCSWLIMGIKVTRKETGELKHVGEKL